MTWKKIAGKLLFPHIAVMIFLIPVSTAMLVYSMAFAGTETVIAYVSYVLSAYTLTVWCIKVPELIRFFKTFKEENKYARRWLDDVHLRVNVSLYGSLALNVVYAVFQLWLGFYHSSFWFYSLAGYYISLAAMRSFLVRYTSRHKQGENPKTEIIKYRTCAIVFLVMNLALALMIFFMVYWNRTFNHHQITAIAMAAYTFTSFTIAIVNIIKYKKYNSPVYSASKAINLAAACVSMLTLESTMLTAFQDETTDAFTRKVLLGVSGGVISAFIIAMAIYMIVNSCRKMNALNNFKEQKNGK